jgi:hypothetical protein
VVVNEWQGMAGLYGKWQTATALGTEIQPWSVNFERSYGDQ